MSSNIATLSQGLPAKKQEQQQQQQQQQQHQNVASPPQQIINQKQPEAQAERQQRKREPSSPSHVPRTESEGENLYVLTLLTDKPLHERMTDLRQKYFPRRINKLAAHLTLYHALPGSKLDTHVIPILLDVTRQTAPFRIEATDPFRLKKGFAINVSSQNGGRQAKQIHGDLQQQWKRDGWLSDQDAGGCRVHYTLMNKVDDELEVQNALDELNTFWKGDSGTAEGLALWRYDRGYWRWERKFAFKGGSAEDKSA